MAPNFELTQPELGPTPPADDSHRGGRRPKTAAPLPGAKKREISADMSGHGHHDDDTAHDDDHHEAETSSDDFPADEPRSPGWLPLLGGALFLAGIAAFVVFGMDSTDSLPGAPPSAAPPSAPAQPAPAQKPALRLPPGMQLPAGHP